MEKITVVILKTKEDGYPEKIRVAKEGHTPAEFDIRWHEDGNLLFAVFEDDRGCPRALAKWIYDQGWQLAEAASITGGDVLSEDVLAVLV